MKRLFVAFLIFLVSSLPLATPSTFAEEPPVKYGIALDVGGVGDNSYNDAVMSTVFKFKKKYQIPDSYVRAVITDGTYLDRLTRLRFFAKSGYSMIIAVGADYNRAISKVANEYPDLTFAIVNSNGVAQLNVSCLTFNESQAAFLAGIAAGARTKGGDGGFFWKPIDPQPTVHSFESQDGNGNYPMLREKINASGIPIVRLNGNVTPSASPSDNPESASGRAIRTAAGAAM